MSIFSDNSLIKFILRHPQKVFFLESCTGRRNTKKQWECIVRTHTGQRIIKWCELPELDRLVESAPPVDMGLRGPSVDGRGKSLWQGIKRLS